MTAIEAIGVVVPAHDEEDLLGACLAALARAAQEARPLVRDARIWVVLDACSDRSEEIARAAGVEIVRVDACNVGRARAAGVEALTATLADVPPARLWIGNTDADSTVPPHWLTDQLRLADAGADVVIGTVRPDFRDLSPEQSAAWWATHTPGIANGHVHGANLGIRASALLTAGGYAPLAEHEDVDLVERMRRASAVCAASDAAWVQTSGRAFGRTDGGYARYLREDLIALARQVPASAAALSDVAASEPAAPGGSESAARREVRDRDGAARA
ncbi:glycosyltransferase [Microbacterium sp.]|uniref:glycosyltransferase n=1 Tax=Microbacterium sp. TaxID=51671 RepID=UPI0028966C2A|nr:glycosyltransferase [Microbacterium sp.]